MKTILHISSDYPDALNARKTRAVLNLVEGTPEFRHVVYSLNRYTAWDGIASLPFGEDRTAVAYGALPKGLFWERRLNALAQWIIDDLRAKNIVPDLVEAHKITVEGLVGERIADAFSCPLICDIQGNTDVKILKRKPGFRKHLRRIAQKTALFFPYAPWMIEPFVQTIGLEKQKCRLLPVLPGLDVLSLSVPLATQKLLTMFDLDRWKPKNLVGLVKALHFLTEDYPQVSLDVYGQGTPASLAFVGKLFKNLGVADRVRLCGPVKNDRVPDLMKNYSAFVMPTLTETYGLVHVEALFSGLPILYSKGIGIDGLVTEGAVGYACDPTSVEDIAQGISYLLDHEEQLKKSIADQQVCGGFDHMRKADILKTYREGLGQVLPKS